MPTPRAGQPGRRYLGYTKEEALANIEEAVPGRRKPKGTRRSHFPRARWTEADLLRLRPLMLRRLPVDGVCDRFADGPVSQRGLQ